MRKLNTREASAYLSERHGYGVKPRTLDNLAWDGRGPLFFKARNGRRLYDPTDLDAWVLESLGHPRRSTSDCAA